VKQIPLSEAAMRLGIDYQQCRRLILTGRLEGGRDAFGRLYALERSVRKAEASRTRMPSKSARGRDRGSR
jgi:hypothetical protein